jgi:predicted Zn-dependent peptidase
MKRAAWFAIAAAAVALFLLPGRAQSDKAPVPAESRDPRIEFERYKLDNGLEVILHQDNSIPLVAVDVWYHVGAGDEVPGRSGFAHLFEHMLFQGSKHIGEDKHFEILKGLGSSPNGSTNFDRTNYFEVVPSHHLETALWIESDRMGYLLPLVTEPSLKNQIDVVRNERRQSYDNEPYGKTRFAVSHLLHPEGHPYRDLVIGKHEDLEAAELADVQGFYKKWYVPGNATLVIAGDFDSKTARELVQKWFGSFPKTSKPSHRKLEMPVIKHARDEVKDSLAKLRRVEYVWHTPAFFAPGDAELDILANALAASGTGRLYKILVHEKQLAQAVASFQASRQHSSYFTVSVTAKSGADLKEIERIMNEEIEKVRSEPITQREFDRAVVEQESGFVWGLESLLARAELLQKYNHYAGNPDFISADLDRYRKSSPAAIQKIAATFLVPDRRAEVLTVPATPEGKK